MGLPSTPYFLCFHYFGHVVVHSHFSTSYTTHGLLFCLFPGSFKPIYPLKAHLFISWTCDPSFLPLGLDGFVTCLLPLLLGFLPSTWILKKSDPQQYVYVNTYKYIYSYMYVYIWEYANSFKLTFVWWVFSLGFRVVYEQKVEKCFCSKNKE